MSATTLNGEYVTESQAHRVAICAGCSKEIFHNHQVNVWVHEETHSSVCGSRDVLNLLHAMSNDDPARHLRFATPCLHCMTGDCLQH